MFSCELIKRLVSCAAGGGSVDPDHSMIKIFSRLRYNPHGKIEKESCSEVEVGSQACKADEEGGKAGSEKIGARKPASKSPAKKPIEKLAAKQSPKKQVANRASAKKPAPKKPVAKKATAKKVIAKKPAASKASKASTSRSQQSPRPLQIHRQRNHGKEAYKFIKSIDIRVKQKNECTCSVWQDLLLNEAPASGRMVNCFHSTVAGRLPKSGGQGINQTMSNTNQQPPESAAPRRGSKNAPPMRLSVNDNDMIASAKDRYGPKDLAAFKKLIEEQRAEASEEFDIISEQMMDTSGEFDADNQAYALHTAEQGTDAMEREKTFLHAQRTSDFIKKLDEAMERIDRGTYGICVVCGNLIEKERLAAVPITQKHVDCKNKTQAKKLTAEPAFRDIEEQPAD